MAADAAQDAAVPAGRDVSAGPGIDLGHLARSEDLLLLDDHGAGAVAPLRIGPDPRGDVVDGIDDVLGTVVARLPLRTLCGIAADRQRRIDQQVEPVGALLDLRA